MRIAILANGSRGDIQPMLALAVELARRGHSIAITVNENLAPWARRTGLDVVSLPIDLEAILGEPSARRMLARGELLRFVRTTAQIHRAANLPLLDALRSACHGADLILSTVMTVYQGMSLAEYFGRPHAVIYTAPSQETGEYAALLGPVRNLGARALNRATHRLFWQLWWKGQARLMQEVRAALALPAWRGAPDLTSIASIDIYSPALSPRPSDWHMRHQVTGSIALSRDLRQQLGEQDLAPGLADWLSAGEAPIYFGLGSLPVVDPASTLRMVADAARARGLRALIGAGWTDYSSAGAETMDHVFIAPAFDHDRVLPQCRAAIHHGGAGTTASVLRAGIPALLASVFGDQPYWGWCVARAGAGLHVRYRDLSPRVLGTALEQLASPGLRAGAQRLRAELQSEAGAERAADVIEAWRSLDVVRAA